MFKLKDILKATGGTLLQGRKGVAVNGISTDSRIIKARELFIALKGENFNGHNFIKDAIKKKAKAIIISEKRKEVYPENFPVILVSDTTNALQDIAIFHRNRFKIPIIVITGSNGKTTTKDMIAHILSKKYRVLSAKGTENNNIGVSKTLLNLNRGHEVVVLELATNHFGEIPNLARISRPDIAIFTNIGKSHLQFLRDLPSVFKEKISLVKYLNPQGKIIFNRDDFHLRKIERTLKRKFKIIPYSIKSDSSFRATKINLGFDYLEFLFNNKVWVRLKTPAEHNVYNALAAIACASNFGISLKTSNKALEDFRPTSMRFNINKIRNFYLIDDSYNSNPLSLDKAIKVLSRYKCGRRILVCGDMRELGNSARKLHFDLGKTIGKNGIDFLITVGPMAKWLAKGAQKGKLRSKNIWRFDTSEKVANRLAGIIEPKDVILVKGSRSIAMERVVEGLKSHFKKI